MKSKKRLVVGLLLIAVVAVIVYFAPTKLLTVGDDTEIIFCTRYDENANSQVLELDDETQAKVLEYLSNCKKYRTLFSTKDSVMLQDMDIDISIFSDGKYTDLHLGESRQYGHVGNAPFRFYIVNGEQVAADIKSMLKDAVAQEQ